VSCTQLPGRLGTFEMDTELPRLGDLGSADHPVEMTHLSPWPDIRLSVQVEADMGIGEKVICAQHLISDQVGHDNVRMALAIT
jgi:hypothetical protein